MPNQINISRLTTLGTTKLYDYLSCPRIFEYRYVFRVKRIVPKAAFGHVLHNMAKRLYTENFKSEESFLKSFRYSWRELKLSQEDIDSLDEARIRKELFLQDDKKIYIESIKKRLGKLKKRYGRIIFYPKANPNRVCGSYMSSGNDILSKFYREHKDEPTPFGTEVPFSLNYEGFDLRGKIDLLKQEGFILNIYDFKTGKSISEENDFVTLRNKGHQSTIYNIALIDIAEKHGLEPGTFYLHFMRTGKETPVPRTDKDFDELKQTLGKVKSEVIGLEAKRVREYDGTTRFVYPQKVDYECRPCMYNDICADEELAFRGDKATIERLGEIVKSIELKRQRGRSRGEIPGQMNLFD